MQKAPYAIAIVAVTFVAACLPAAVGRGAASLMALTGVTFFMDGLSSEQTGRYPGTSCLIYAADQTITVSDSLPSFWEGWQNDFATGFNRHFLERAPYLIKTECGRRNPDFEKLDVRNLDDGSSD